MGLHTIKMPDIGEGIAEVELVAWHVKPGDVVKEDQVLADVMTDKANVEIPSPVNGTVLALGGEVGQVLAVGSELIRIEVAEMAEAGSVKRAEKAGVLAGAPPDRAPRALTPALSQGEREQEPERRSQSVPPPPLGEGRGGGVGLAAQPDRPTPAQDRAARALTPALSQGEREQHAFAQAEKVQDRPIASPSVRRRAWELGVELEHVRGTGAGGRIMHGDLEVHVAKHGSTLPGQRDASGDSKDMRGARTSANTPEVVTITTSPAYAENHEQTQIPVIGVRRKIAQKMQESKRRIPHFTYVEEIDVTDVEQLRVQLNDRFGTKRGKLTMLPFIARAMVIALRDLPQINARFDDEAGIITRYGAAHIGVATQTDAGLMVPVMRHAESRDLWSMAREVTRLADASRAGKVTRDELTGSTITLTSLGALGGIASTPVINHPEVAIVGVNRIVERPVYKHGTIVPRKLMNLSSSFDHRVVDGIDAAKFIQLVRTLLETPTALFVD